MPVVQLENELHTTLYYYDLAGNLIRTVPPKGTKTDGAHNLFDISASRKSLDFSEQTDPAYQITHDLTTEYRYNALNQPVWQKTPDGGVTEFWYDRLGRIVLSQNSKQKGSAAPGDSKRYSYTLYDAMGRTIEVGEVLYGDTVLQDQLYANVGYLNSLLVGKVTREITRTYYDFAAFPIHLSQADAFGTEGQKNLLHRVSSVVYYPGGTYTANASNPFDANYLVQTVDMNDNPVTVDALPRTYRYATHYSYDIHGNVHRVVQEFRELEGMAQSFKGIDYAYDLLSGKVTQVAYQQGRPDQFFHRYVYDADNKLLEVQTSADGFIWDRDAKYEYHLHGALARTVLGDWSVQGIDFAYTLQGWLKGVNGDGIDPARDMGGDHNNLLTAQDAMQFGLSYYAGDYSADAQAAPVFDAVAAGPNLYNGNISGSNMRIPGSFTAMQYGYDQLNRLKRAQHVQRSGTSWTNQSAYSSSYQYDANGNLTQLIRNGHSGQIAMDDLTYEYTPGTNQLVRVGDKINAANYPTDIDDQPLGTNYEYDPVGNLVRDKAEGLRMKWTPYGKLAEVTRDANVAGASLQFGYDASGQRVMKEVRLGNPLLDSRDYYVRDASGNTMALYRLDARPTNSAANHRIFWDTLAAMLPVDTLIALTSDSLMRFPGLNWNLSQSLRDNEIYLSPANDCDPLQWQPQLAGMIGNVPNTIWDPSTIWGQLPEYDELIIAAVQTLNKQELLNQMLNSPDFLEALSRYFSGNIPELKHLQPLFEFLVSYVMGMPYNNALNVLYNNYYLPHNQGSPHVTIGNDPNFNPYYVFFTQIAPQKSILQWMVQGETLYPFLNDFILKSFGRIAIDFFSPTNWSIFGGQIMLALPPQVVLILLQNHPQVCQYINQNIDITFLNSLILNHATTHGMTQATGRSFFTQAMANATANTSSTALPELLAFVGNRLGQTRANQFIAKVGHRLIVEQQYTLRETYLYGSSRLGVKNQQIPLSTRVASVQNGSLIPVGNPILNTDSVFSGTAAALGLPQAIGARVLYRTWGLKQYELSNHLGNVQVTVSDKKIGVVGSNNVDFTSYQADIKSATDYYAYGMEMPGKGYQSTAYRYGMNTQEKDNEIYGPGNTFGALYWEYDARIARRWNVDPVVKEYEGGYTAFSGNPIWFVDPAGSDTEIVNSAGERLDCIPSPQVDGKDHKIVQLKEISISSERETTADKIKETFFAGLGVVGGVSEVAIGVGIGAASSGISLTLSSYLGVDGFVRVTSSLSKIGIIWGKDVTDNSSQIHKKNLIESIPSSISNLTGKVLDNSFEMKEKQFERSLTFAGDVLNFSIAGGTGAIYLNIINQQKRAKGLFEVTAFGLESSKNVKDLNKK